MTELELYHHGILGMKWGTRNGPPYPLDDKDHSASEKKAGWKKSLDNGSDTKEKTPAKGTASNVTKGREAKSGDDFDGDKIVKESDHNKALSKHPSDMSDKELLDAVNRLRNEKSYLELVDDLAKREKTASTSRVKKAAKWLASTTGRSFQKGFENISAQTMTYILGATVNKIASEFVDDPRIVNPKKGQKDK